MWSGQRDRKSPRVTHASEQAYRHSPNDGYGGCAYFQIGVSEALCVVETNNHSRTMRPTSFVMHSASAPLRGSRRDCGKRAVLRRKPARILRTDTSSHVGDHRPLHIESPDGSSQKYTHSTTNRT